MHIGDLIAIMEECDKDEAVDMDSLEFEVVLHENYGNNLAALFLLYLCASILHLFINN